MMKRNRWLVDRPLLYGLVTAVETLVFGAVVIYLQHGTRGVTMGGFVVAALLFGVFAASVSWLSLRRKKTEDMTSDSN